MVFFKIYYRKKNKFELFLLREGNFKNVTKAFDLKSKKAIYPILAKERGLTYRVNEFQGYIFGSLKYFYDSFKKEHFGLKKDLTYQQMSDAIDILGKRTVDIENTLITALYFGFTVSTEFIADDFIRRNLMMHKYNGYNHDRSITSKKELKIFDLNEYEIFISADKKQEDGVRNYLKVELRIKESKIIRKLGVKSPLDLKDKKVLDKLFNLFLKKYDELTIIDSLVNYEQFSKKEKLKMPLYMNVDYWKELPKIKNRQAKLRAKKEFERIQKDYLLNKMKRELRKSLINAFEIFLNN